MSELNTEIPKISTSNLRKIINSPIGITAGNEFRRASIMSSREKGQNLRIIYMY